VGVGRPSQDTSSAARTAHAGFDFDFRTIAALLEEVNEPLSDTTSSSSTHEAAAKVQVHLLARWNSSARSATATILYWNSGGTRTDDDDLPNLYDLNTAELAAL